MNGLTNTYLNLTALPSVGVHLLAQRPAFVTTADGRRIVWANAPAVSYFDQSAMGGLLDLAFSPFNPMVAQLARLSRQLPSDTARMEILRVGRGTRLALLTAACQRLNLPDEDRGVLVVGATADRPLSLAARAERLTSVIGSRDCLVSILTGDGRVLAASGGSDGLAAAEADIDRLIEGATASGDHLLATTLDVGGRERPAGVARFEDSGAAAYLVMIGPAEATTADAAPMPVEAPRQQDNQPQAAETDTVDTRDEPGPVAPSGGDAALSATARFIWESDADQRIKLVSAALADVVGEANAAINGHRWDEIGDVLGFELSELEVGAWNARVDWPVAATGKTVAVDLTALAPGASGQRGFGVIRLDETGDDARAEKTTLADRVSELTSPRPTEQPEETAPSAPADDEPPSADDTSDEAVVDAADPSDAPPVVADERDEPDPGDLDDKARREVETGAPSAGSNARRVDTTPLSGHEREAFRRIGESLGHADQPVETAGHSDPGDTRPAPQIAPSTNAAEVILDRVPLGLMILRDGETLFINRALTHMLGYDSSKALKKAGGIDAVFPGGTNHWSGRDMTGAGGRLFAARHDGGTIAVHASMRSVVWGDAASLMLALKPDAGDAENDDMAADLASVAARASELEAVLDTATDGVAVIDRDGNVVNLNHAAEALFGVESTDMIGRPFADLLAEESRRAALDYLDGLASAGVASILNDGREVIGRVPRGGLIPLFMTMGRIGDGQTYCAVLRDITHWKNVEEELVAAKREAEDANQQKSEFLAKVSHEIRTPLNAIIGFSEVMIEERFGAISNERYRSYLRDIHTSGGHLMSLINDLLDLSKIEAGKMELNFESVPVNELIQETVALMQPQANRERIIIRTSLSTEVPNVVADQRSIRQILLNLLSNSVKFTGAGGQVIVSTGLEQNGEVVLRVRDTGVGMSDKDVRAALQPFRQLATSKREVDKGTGLGLPLTKALVEANRAAFDIESAVDQGTLVRITFPTTRVLAG